MLKGTIYVKVPSDEYVPITGCTLEERDGGIFVHEESRRSLDTVTWFRIGTLPQDHLDEINRLNAESD